MARIPSLLILIAFVSYSAYSDATFVSIDCGSSSSSYTDENGIIWQGDATLIGNGQPYVVQSKNGVSQVMTTLRAFTTRKKNCYAIGVDKGQQVLVRASFYYGNYDQKLNPPTFDLQFDGNDWGSVQTLLDQVMVYETIYVAKYDYVSVCVAQTQPNQYPFISALEVRPLLATMYGSFDPEYALFLTERLAYGSNAIIRYPADNYDRIWTPANAGTGLKSVTSDATSINTETDNDPPESAIRNAITPVATSGSIQIGLAYNTTSSASLYYLNLYFSEVVDTTLKRSFWVNANNKLAYSSPIVPTYGVLTQLVLNDTNANSDTFISLVPTTDSDLPPLINALEAFIISDPLTDGTDSNDVDGFSALQTGFSNLQEWSGDPCLPSPYTWDWLNCSSDAVPRVTALFLGGYNLSGFLPDFSSMDALVTIDLHNNNIGGEIPDFLGTLPNLRVLNLANNAFTGAIPSSITTNTNLKLLVTGNPGLCTSGNSCQTTAMSGEDTPSSSSSGGKKSSKLPVILGSTIPIVVIFWVIVGVLVVLQQKRKKAAIAAVAPGNGNGVNIPNVGGPQAGGASAGDIIMGKIGQAIVDEIKVNIQEQMTPDQSANASPSQPLYQVNQ